MKMGFWQNFWGYQPPPSADTRELRHAVHQLQKLAAITKTHPVKGNSQ